MTKKNFRQLFRKKGNRHKKQDGKSLVRFRKETFYINSAFAACVSDRIIKTGLEQRPAQKDDRLRDILSVWHIS